MKTVVIGTLYSGEGDFEYCCKSVKSQDYPCEQFVISDTMEAKAHSVLYRTFKDSDYDYLIKLDADMVFIDNNAVRQMVSIADEGGYDKVSFKVQDFFTNSKFFGVHLFSKRVNWKWKRFVSKNIKPDRLDTAKHVYLSKNALVYHCYHANIKQSFHYGFHRMHKGQVGICNDVLSNLERSPKDVNLLSACKGIYAALCNKSFKSNDYNEDFELIFNTYSKKSLPSIATIKGML